MFFIPKSRIDKVKRSWKRLPEPQILLDKSKELFNQESLRIFEAVDNVKAISGIRLFSFFGSQSLIESIEILFDNSQIRFNAC